MEIVNLILIYLAIINIISFYMFYNDKRKAKKDKWRTPEKTLHFLSVAGGVGGSIAAMMIFRHKTKKTGFCLITITALAIDIFVLYKLWEILIK